MFEVELLAEAEFELADAFDWYEQQQATLGTKFYREVNHYLSLIEQNPFQFPIRYPSDLRVAALNKFPYLIIFWLDENDKLAFVNSIFHTSRESKFQ